MILSRGRNYLFIHIPKTGGTALSLALEARAMKDDIIVGDTPKAQQRKNRLRGVKTAGRLWKHSTVADLDGLLERDEAARLFVFTIVRNPWDRMVSYYHWLKAQDFDHRAVALAKRVGFSDFVLHPSTAASFRASPASHYVTDAAGQEVCDLFIRFEDLAGGVSMLEDRLDVKLGSLEHVNASKRQADWRSLYGDAERDAVARMCAPDIARFGYEF